ncbi:hypothetical protein AN958_11901 [Leucoagaricus sp. SymC.cos]|nr:hypothetical protein AN958_11897 [Leucoagaricus sp. SymC.cos]KXN84918.1 hypothetical protein AN958_11901 [Leucoagaricus sp. SymC.cos]
MGSKNAADTMRDKRVADTQEDYESSSSGEESNGENEQDSGKETSSSSSESSDSEEEDDANKDDANKDDAASGEHENQLKIQKILAQKLLLEDRAVRRKKIKVDTTAFQRSLAGLPKKERRERRRQKREKERQEEEEEQAQILKCERDIHALQMNSMEKQVVKAKTLLGVLKKTQRKQVETSRGQRNAEKTLLEMRGEKSRTGVGKSSTERDSLNQHECHEEPLKLVEAENEGTDGKFHFSMELDLEGLKKRKRGAHEENELLPVEDDIEASPTITKVAISLTSATKYRISVSGERPRKRLCNISDSTSGEALFQDGQVKMFGSEQIEDER